MYYIIVLIKNGVIVSNKCPENYIQNRKCSYFKTIKPEITKYMFGKHNDKLDLLHLDHKRPICWQGEVNGPPGYGELAYSALWDHHPGPGYHPDLLPGFPCSSELWSVAQHGPSPAHRAQCMIQQRSVFLSRARASLPMSLIIL